jgi:inorganic pyrophosphatase
MQAHVIPPRASRDGQVHVIIDTPAGSANKYKFDEALGVFRVSRKLPDGMVFPHNFGSIPGTCAQDGDPLDVLIVGLPALFPGCLVTARILGVLHARQMERGKPIRNDRLIAVGETPVNQSSLRKLEDLTSEQLAEITHFFKSYNAAQGRDFNITGRGERAAAEKTLVRAIRAFETRQGKETPRVRQVSGKHSPSRR